jgi:uncharacterized protein
MALPSVHQNEVPEKGLSLTCAVQPEELTLPGDEGRFRGDLTIEVEIHLAARGLMTRGVLAGVAVRECVRCLAEFEEPLEVPFTAEYRARNQPRGGRKQAPAKSPDDEQDSGEETYPYDGERLDLAEMLREQVILAGPMHPLCRKDCLGLCPVCGQNRNQRSCACPEPREANPFMVLRERQHRTGRMTE